MMILKTSRSNLSSNDQLSLDLPFAATKSLTARVGPTPTFTRGSGATYIGSDGLIHGVDTSTTSNTIGTGSRTFTLAATAGQDQLWRTGDVVEASNGANLMTGTVTSYTPSTQSLVCNMTSIGGSGTFTSWRIGYRGPRFDHTSAGVCRGLLIEEARTNLILQSGNFANASWVKTGGSISSVANVAPDGNANSELFSEDGANSTHRTFQSFTGVSGTSYTISVFLKFAGRDQIFLENRSIGTNPLVVFNIQNGTIGFVSSGLTAAIQAYPNGWYRCSITGTATLAGGNYLIGGYSGGSQAYTGLNGPAFYLYGAQVEAGSFATSYIPTTTGSVARSADVCSITGTPFSNMWNASEGSTFFNGISAGRASGVFGTAAFFLDIASSTTDRLSQYATGIGSIRPEIKTANIDQYTPTAPAYTNNTVARQSIGFRAGETSSGFFNNTAFSGGINIALTTPSVNGLYIGTSSATSNFCNGTISSIRYYRKRLPNAKLQALTV